MSEYRVVEKANHLHLHALCCTEEIAQRWINEKAPVYCSRGYFMDKTLTPDSFIVLPPKSKK